MGLNCDCYDDYGNCVDAGIVCSLRALNYSVIGVLGFLAAAFRLYCHFIIK